MSNRSFVFTQANSSPFKGLDGSVTFSDGTQTTDKILLLAANGLGAPNLNTQTQNAPFQQGASLIRTLFQPRTITLECAISVPSASSIGRSEVTTIKRRLSKYLSPVGMGFLPDTSLTMSNYSTRIGKLSYASDGSTFDRFIDCVPMTVEWPNAYYKDGFQKMRVVFFCPDPFWYGADQTQTMANVSVGLSALWVSIAWSPELGIFCAIAANSTSIQTSPDGITWTARTGVSSVSWFSIAWSPELGLFCAIAENSTSIQTSPDGITWTLRTGVSSATWTSVTWSPELGLFCAVALNSTSIQTSPDGINWTLRTGAASAPWICITWSPQLSLFCAIAENSTSIQTSPNGTAWTSRTGVSSVDWRSIAWSPELGIFCAIAENSTSIQTSPDGINWTLRTGVSSAAWISIAWSPELRLFCVVANGSTSVQTSPDGINWTLRTGAAASEWYSIAWSPQLGIFCSVALQTLQYPEISYDGINWIQNSATTDWYATVNNQGDIPATFALTVPIKGGETGKVIAIGENFLWAGSGDPPSDHNIVFSTEGLKTGNVILNTKFGNKTITQFGDSVMNNFVGGTFFSLYVSGSQSNILYLRNTGTPSTAPSFTYRNRYISV